MQRRQQIAIISVILLWVLQLGQTEAGGRLKTTGWTAACNLNKELDKVEQKPAHRLETPMETVNSYLKHYFHTKIYTEAYRNGHYTETNKALLAYYAHKADRAANERSSTAVGKLASAIRDAARAEGSIRDFIGPMEQISTTSGTDGCLEKETGSDTHKPHSDGFSGPSSGCKISTTALATTDTTTAQFTQTGNDGGLQTAATVAATTDGTSETCTITAGKTSSRLLDVGNGDSSMQGEPRFASGLYYIHTNGMKRQATGSLSTTKSANPALKATHNDYPNTQYTSLTYKTQTGEQLKEDPDFRTIYAMLVKKKRHNSAT
uniref:Variant surface glycoprotein n=1 Tax=Trypanosoma brucei TaxID=5691 RepID=A0A1V0FY73_9TRYP|nr:variant surface glycoprotein [Trypanosoma brucei]